ncbi:MAG: DsbA family oxidoreductase [Ferruginibacter sp.]|nr:DsbA family oxidoreductase [Ferruginibacter sp.]
MKVEIWSDIVCPFCYIGKRKFEKALENFPGKEDVEVIWRSFQLDPGMKVIPGQSVDQYLAKRKGVSLEKGKEMNAYMSGVAREVGLEYNFDKAIINNTLDAHRLLHLAKKKGGQNELKEKLFAAYYTEGKDIADRSVLTSIGESIGLEAEEISRMFSSDEFIDKVQYDQHVAEEIGANGVPFYVFNNKYAVSGAQAPDVFTEVLNKVWEEEKPIVASDEPGLSCTPEGVCT